MAATRGGNACERSGCVAPTLRVAKHSFEPASVPDREATIVALRNGDLELEHAAAELRADRDVVLTAINAAPCGSSFKHASAELRG